MALLLTLMLWTSGELSEADTKRYAASLWDKAFALHTECTMAHAYRLLRVNGTVHALAYHQVGVTGPAFTCDHYAWIGGEWTQRGTNGIADLSDGHTSKDLITPLALQKWPSATACLFLDVNKVHDW